jgi:hypothetical protein
MIQIKDMECHNDILIYGRSLEEHANHVRQVLTVLQAHKFYVKRSKCDFAKSELEYLGHIISEQEWQQTQRKLRLWLIGQYLI